MMSQQLEIWGTRDPNISAQLVLAVQMELFKKEVGLDVACRFLESGTMMPEAVLNADTPPFAFMQTPITAILLHDKGFQTKVVAPLADIAGSQQMIIHPQSAIVHPKDLEGKRLGIAQDAAIYIAVRNMAHDYNMALDRVELVHLLPHDQLTAFAEGTLDAIACWEPWITKARQMGGQVYFSGARSEIPGMEGDVNWLVDQACLIVPDDHLANQAQEVKAILQVLRQATDLINDHRQEIAKELAPFFDMTPPELIAAMRKNLYSVKFDNLFRIGILGFRDFLYHHGDVSHKFSEQELYDTTLLQQVDADLIALEETVSQDIPIVERSRVYYRQDVAIVKNGRDVRFLVADDSKVVRNALFQTIEILGGRVLGEATTGQEAIDLFQQLRPNFVTMDLSMPGMSGIDAIKEILHIEPETNIIVISATDLQELREEAFDLGVKIFIVKPFDPLQVAEIIGLLLL
ncbi:response regulator [candidate division KSB3 bacterium]|uniref:Response regulator n=1 Tax=candidate division KSB3 bacterium TaxID=2044937 RepID=A0A9D5Q6L0_9BACT|nr:response regulator [candidate division KSB3 bacterium]MBD3325021.1 response regulator [candidate division KSB3 bacterium]